MTGFIKRFVSGWRNNPTTAVEPANVNKKSSLDFLNWRKWGKKTAPPTTPAGPAPAAVQAHPAAAVQAPAPATVPAHPVAAPPPPPHDYVR